MAEVVNLPKLGFDMNEGTFVNWVKNVGETVKAGDVLAEIESDKATIEVESTASGTLIEQLVKVGDTVPVGAPIAKIQVEGGEVDDIKGAAPAKADVKETKAPAAQQPAAQQPAAQQPPAEVQLKHNGKAPAPAAQHAAASTGEDFPGGIKASPIARKMAEEKGIDLRQIKGTGPGGRITKSDVEDFQPGVAAPAAPAAAPAARPQPSPMIAPTGADMTDVPLTKLRQRIASRMVESKQNVPHFYVTVEIDMAPALALRKQINEGLPDEQKVSVNDLVVKATALTLRQFPNLNSHYYGDKIVRHNRINIGIAVALDGGGLMNVIAKDADITAISRMAQKNKEMIAAARSGKVRPDDVEGGTFTVSNLGPYDVEQFVAIINPPEAGIIAVGSARDVPVVINGELKVGTRMKCTLSADHRVTDGAEGAQFMQAFKKLLESPMRLLI
ncbi:MAG: 2-oxo acid dehydrogenase subunit E2 [Anaerolineae bacterium]|nr:2-oxo acid dehydrogenase subunit E2 [Anaerolineae bacterium]